MPLATYVHCSSWSGICSNCLRVIAAEKKREPSSQAFRFFSGDILPERLGILFALAKAIKLN